MTGPSSPSFPRSNGNINAHYGSTSSSLDDTCSSSQGHKYEEFMGDSIECPTCRGLGRIGSGNDELVALIPLSDARLKPRKTVLYVIIAIALCLTVGGLLLFFFISRSITLSCNQQVFKPKNITLIDNNVTEKLFLSYQVPINITNDNYFPISVTELDLASVLYGDSVLATSKNLSKLTIPMRSTRQHYIQVNLTVNGNQDLKHLIDVCQGAAPILWKLPMNFQVTTNISYLSHNESASITLYNRKVCCHATQDTRQPPSPFEDCVND